MYRGYRREKTLPWWSLYSHGDERELTCKAIKTNFRKNLPTHSNLVRKINTSGASRLLNLRKHSIFMSSNNEDGRHRGAEWQVSRSAVSPQCSLSPCVDWMPSPHPLLSWGPNILIFHVCTLLDIETQVKC